MRNDDTYVCRYYGQSGYGYQVKLVANACATMDLEIAGEIIPAETVQKVFIASLEGVFATVI